MTYNPEQPDTPSLPGTEAEDKVTAAYVWGYNAAGDIGERVRYKRSKSLTGLFNTAMDAVARHRSRIYSAEEWDALLVAEDGNRAEIRSLERYAMRHGVKHVLVSFGNERFEIRRESNSSAAE